MAQEKRSHDDMFIPYDNDRVRLKNRGDPTYLSESCLPDGSDLKANNISVQEGAKNFSSKVCLSSTCCWYADYYWNYSDMEIWPRKYIILYIKEIR